LVRKFELRKYFLKNSMKKYLLFLFLLAFFFLGPVIVLLKHQVDFNQHWSTASRESAHLAPDPKAFSPAVLQIYQARTYGWRGLWAVHIWLAFKERNSGQYVVLQVLGWRAFQGLSVVLMTKDLPDRYWFGNKPQLIKDWRGEEAEKIITQTKTFAAQYSYPHYYNFWPGPNSNTFFAFLGRSIPELKLSLSPLAVGKDFLGLLTFFAKTPSGTGYQISFWGIIGFMVAKEEGIELNICGLVAGINPAKKTIFWPGLEEIHF
jgi:hypothetical protein